MQTSRRIRIPWLGIPLAVSLALTACNYPGVQATEPPGDAIATAAAQTVSAELTQVVAVATTAVPPTETPAPVLATSTPANTQPAPTATSGASGCTDKATFVTDVTVPDNTNMSPGQAFTKTWRLKNVGTCTWTTDYDLVFDSGNAMGGSSVVGLGASVPPNGTIDISNGLTAPSSNGTFKGNYKLRNDKGIIFGIGTNADVAFWVQIVVGPTATPEATVYHSGKINLQQTYNADFDKQVVAPSTGSDLWFEAVSASEMYLTPQNGAKFKLITSGAPSYEKCSTTSLSSNKISLDDISVHDWLCFKTDEGRYGRAEIEDISGNPKVMRIDIVTLKK
jgi:uncharacterized protein affecting Mg2+/Co2+ transport